MLSFREGDDRIMGERGTRWTPFVLTPTTAPPPPGAESKVTDWPKRLPGALALILLLASLQGHCV